MIFDFLMDIGTYESRKVARTECKNGLIVSTCYTSDEGYETAILDKKHVHPVERYSGRTEAQEGHKKWVKFAQKAKKGTAIKMLGGLSGLVEDQQIKLAI